MRTPYDSSGAFGRTPAPAADVILEWNGRSSMVRALIDTGASITAIPRAEYVALRLRKISTSVPVGGAADVSGDRAVVNITFEGRTYRNLPVITTDQLRHTLIGRDILNRYVLECDGPRLEFSVALPAST